MGEKYFIMFTTLILSTLLFLTWLIYKKRQKAKNMDNDFDHKSNVEELMGSAVEYQANSIRARAATRDRYRKEEPHGHNSFRITLDGLIVRASSQLANKVEVPTEKISWQIGIAISFIRTHFIIDDMIMDGDLIEACTLIRKNLESVTRLNEIDNGPILKLFKKTPNVANVFKQGGKQLYPQLSEIAHFGTPRISELLSVSSFEDGRVGPSLYPAHNVDALACYDKHAFVSIYFAFWLIQFLKTVYGDKYSHEADEATFYIMSKIAEENGIIQLPKEEEVKPIK